MLAEYRVFLYGKEPRGVASLSTYLGPSSSKDLLCCCTVGLVVGQYCW